jgi:uncharacterized membrane protein YphA (DoxX/SURF4 family)
MKLDEPIGDSLYGPLLVRYSLGAYFILAGLYKLDKVGMFVQEVQGFELLPGNFAILYGHFLPYLEIVVGVFLLIGFWITATAFVSSLLLLSFILALGIFPNTDRLFNKDLILLGASLSLLYSGGGAMSIDRFRKVGNG